MVESQWESEKVLLLFQRESPNDSRPITNLVLARIDLMMTSMAARIKRIAMGGSSTKPNSVRLNIFLM